MTDIPTSQEPRANAGLIERVKDVLLRPKAAWAVIDGEAATVKSLFLPYVLVLAAIGPLANLIGGQVFGYRALWISYRPDLFSGLTTAALSYVMTLAGVYVLALIIDALAPSFGGTKNPVQAMKVSAYSGTAAWIAGVFGLIPALGVLGIVGLYSLYLLYLGLPRLMKTPQDKALGYTAVVVVLAIVVWLVIGAASAAVSGAIGGARALGAATPAGEVRINLPGAGALSSRDAEETARALEKAAEAPPVAVEAMAGLLPDRLGGLQRVSQSTNGGLEGVSGGSASADYEQGEARISLSVTDMGPMAAMAGLAGAFGAQSSSDADGRYERMGRVDGRLTTESYDPASRSGAYGVIAGDRIMIQADGSNVDMEALKRAVAAVDPRRAERLLR